MIKLSDEMLQKFLKTATDNESEGIALPNYFWRDSFGDGSLYFFTDTLEEETYLGVHLEKNGENYIPIPKEIKLKMIPSKINLGNVVETVDTTSVVGKSDVIRIYDRFFNYLSYERGPEALFNRNIISLLFDYIEQGYYFNDGDTFIFELFSTFILSAKMDTDYYGNLLLDFIELKDSTINKEIASFKFKTLEGIIEIRDESEKRDILSAYLEYLSQEDAKNIVRKILS